MNTKRRGFTLIELLVTMTIIAVLAGLALVSYEGTRKSARDSKRKADLEQIRSALEMYRADNGIYPANTGLLGPYLTPPSDPISGRQYGYLRGATNTTYILCAALETVTAAAAGCPAAPNNCGSATCSYRVDSP